MKIFAVGYQPHTTVLILGIFTKCSIYINVYFYQRTGIYFRSEQENIY